MRRFVAALLFALCVAALPAAGAAHAAPANSRAASTTTPGTLTGTLVNGSQRNAPIANAVVTLRTYDAHSQPQDTSSVHTDGAGRFTFTNLDGSGAATYDVYTLFQSGTFTSGVVTFAKGPTQQVTLTVYVTSSSDANVHVSLATILFSSPNQLGGYLPVGEYVTFDNTGTTAYVAAPGAANGAPMGLLRFMLPTGATNLTLGAGFSANQQVNQVSTGFATTATIPPGQTQFAFAYDLPYSATALDFPFKAEYTTDQVAVLMPMGVAVSAGDYTTQPPVTANGANYQLFTQSAIAHDRTLTMRLTQLPTPGERPYLTFRQLVAVGVILALLLTLLMTLYLRRGALAVVFGLVPAATLRARSRGKVATGGGSTAVRGQGERKRLLRELLSLEASHEAGKLDDATFRVRSGGLRARLRALLATDTTTARARDAQTSDREPSDLEKAQPVETENSPNAAMVDDMEQATPTPTHAEAGGTR